MIKKTNDIFLCLLSILITFVFLFVLLIGNDNLISEKEKRALQGKPTLSFTNIISGKYFSELSDFCSDQFPMRDTLTTASTLGNILLRRSENNGIIFAKNGFLIPRQDYKDLDTLQKNCNSISEFINKNNSNGTPSYILLAPRSIDVNSNQLPSLYPKDINSDVYDIFNRIIPKKYSIQTTSLFKDISNNENVWYRTDHHWTTTGAYYVYKELGKKLQYTPKSKEFFNIEIVSTDFLGSSYSSSGLNSVPHPDTIELYRYDNDEKILINEPTINKTRYGFYDFSALRKSDKYCVFLGGNTDVLEIRALSKRKPKLLLIKDSFANSIIPFLSIHFDIDVVDLRYYKGSIKKYISNNNFDYILLLYGIDTLSTDISCSYILK